jgi:hypothetical protein
MSQTYTYSISVDFPNNAVAPDVLTIQINDSSISTGVLEGITLRTPDTDTCYITFDVALSAPDVTTLDGIVAVHTGVPLPVFEQSDNTAAIFRLEGSSDNGVAMLQLCQTNIAGEWVDMENAVDGTAVVRFRQSAAGHPRFNMFSATGSNKIRLGPEIESYIVSTAFGIGTDAPNTIYGVDIAGDVNTDSDYLTGGVIVINSTKDLVNVRTANYSAEYDNGSQAGPSYTVDWNNGQKQAITLTGNITTMNLTAPAGVGNFLLRVVQDGTGSRTITWPASVKWPGGTAPTLSTGANAEDIVTFYYNGTDYYGVASLNFS